MPFLVISLSFTGRSNSQPSWNSASSNGAFVLRQRDASGRKRID